MSYPNPNDLWEVREREARKQWVADIKQYGIAEFWTFLSSLGGDCEDFVLTWFDELLALGWPPEAMRVGICFVEPFQFYDTEINNYRWALPFERGHAVLQVELPDGRVLVLDQRQTFPCTLRFLKDLGYTPFEIQDAKTRLMVSWSWECASTEKTGVVSPT